jgi:hypothetical protein
MGFATCQGTVQLVHGLQEKCGTILAKLLNKLAANSLPASWRPGSGKVETRVQLTPESPALSTPEDLLEALIKNEQADVYMQVVTRITGFGLGALRRR